MYIHRVMCACTSRARRGQQTCMPSVTMTHRTMLYGSHPHTRAPHESPPFILGHISSAAVRVADLSHDAAKTSDAGRAAALRRSLLPLHRRAHAAVHAWTCVAAASGAEVRLGGRWPRGRRVTAALRARRGRFRRRPCAWRAARRAGVRQSRGGKGTIPADPWPETQGCGRGAVKGRPAQVLYR